MWNKQLKKPLLTRQRAIWAKAWFLPLALILGSSQVQAQQNHCFRLQDLTPSTAWSMVPSGTTFKNGDIVGRTSAYARYSMPLAHGDEVEIVSNSRSVNNIYNAYPLSGMPGLGLVMRWGGYTATSTLTQVGPGSPPGTAFVGYKPLLHARTTANFTLTHLYDFELVVIDATLYKGGKLTFTDSNHTLIATTSRKAGSSSGQACYDGFLDPMAALTGTVQVPELPKPVLPTCTFTSGNMNQRVTLGPVDPGQIVPVGSARPAGSAGQTYFYVDALNCSKGAKVAVYLTDTRDTGRSKDYLLTSNPAVGIRLYYSGEYDTMPFGSPPSGSWVPSRYAPTQGPAAYNGAKLSFPFTVQYVRLPNKTEADVKPGPLEAAAVLVVVYP